MVRGHPDYGVSGQTEVVSKVTDLGELGVRLGSPSWFDRSGNVVYQDGECKSLAPYGSNSIGTDSSVVVDGSKSLRYPQSIKLTPGDTESDYAYISKHFPIIDTSRIGFEFTFHTYAFFREFTARIHFLDGEYDKVFGIKINEDDGKVYYYDSTGSWSELLSFESILGNNSLWHTLKVVGDFENDEYVRFFLDDRKESMNGLSTYKSSWTSYRTIYFVIKNYGYAGSNSEMNINDIIVTTNEPI